MSVELSFTAQNEFMRFSYCLQGATLIVAEQQVTKLRNKRADRYRQYVDTIQKVNTFWEMDRVTGASSLVCSYTI